MNPDELVDIVDENMNFVRIASKKNAHKEGWLHKCVIGQVIDSNGRWLFVKQASDRQDAGQYVSPMGGHVSVGEKEEDALKREVLEELGIKDFKYEFIGKGIYNREVIGRKENHFFLYYRVFSDASPTISQEAESFKYFTESEIKKALKDSPEIFGDAFHYLVKNNFIPHLYD